jgi:hypothetical protein
MCYLQVYLKNHLADKMPKMIPFCYDGRMPKEDRLKRVVGNLLNGKDATDYVIALTDIYMGVLILKMPPMQNQK